MAAIAETLRECFRIWDAMKADGASFAERCRTLEKTLRVTWPFTREWKYLCDRCDDTGLVLYACPGDATCGRHKVHNAHEYCVPCWCEKGAPFRPPKKTETDELTAVGRTSRPTRIGR